MKNNEQEIMDRAMQVLDETSLSQIEAILYDVHRSALGFP